MVIPHKIAQMQGELNALVGINTLEMSAEALSGRALRWATRFMEQFATEAMECRDNFYHKWWSKEVKDGTVRIYTLRSREKAVVEIIDMLHFYVSALQCLGYPSAWETLWSVKDIPNIVFDEEAHDALLKLVSLSLSETKVNFHRISQLMTGLFRYFRLSHDDIFAIYKKKHAANVKRQENGYSVDTKTEADNLAIENEIYKEDL